MRSTGPFQSRRDSREASRAPESGARTPAAGGPGGEDLRGKDLSGADFSGARLFRADLRGACLRGACLEDAELTGADLTGADLEGVRAARAGLGAACLEDAKCFEADLRGATLSRAKLAGSDLRCARLDDARLREADLARADLTGACLKGADLTTSFMKNATLNGADLRNSELAGIRDFSSASWIGVDTRDVNFAGAYLLRRFIIDENYLEEFRTQSRFAAAVYWIWKLSSDCGRSMTRWFFLILSTVLIYAVAFAIVGADWGDHETVLSPLYFSIVTITTLGYGDVLPASLAGQVLVICEVLTGYLMLGGLLAIFTNKMARRGD